MISTDQRQKEIYVCDPAGRSILIFNGQGMEVFRFGEDDRLGYMYDLAVLDSGDLLLLSYAEVGQGSRPALVRCSFRGEVQAWTELPDFPGTADFRPSRIIRKGERLLLVDLPGMRVMETDLTGKLRENWNLGELLGLSSGEVADAGLGGFSVDHQGNFLFTVPVQFAAFRLRPDGTLESFGQPGSSPGRFGVVAAIAGDSRGHIYIVDTLRCVVSVFDASFTFLGEFGQRGTGPGGLIAPKELAVGDDGRIYVTQMAKRGVNVYRVNPG